MLLLLLCNLVELEERGEKGRGKENWEKKLSLRKQKIIGKTTLADTMRNNIWKGGLKKAPKEENILKSQKYIASIELTSR